jgi:3-oxoadipate enol-lactonase
MEGGNMAFFMYKDHEIHYEFQGKAGDPVIVFINGLTQRTQHWLEYADYLSKKGFQVLTYDLLGQGISSKPILFVDFDENTDVLDSLLNHLNIDKAYVMGISFGGVIALKFGMHYPKRVNGLVIMSAFTEMDGQLLAKGKVLYEGMTQIGFEYFVNYLFPINMSSKWIEQNEDLIPQMRWASFSYNDLYSVQNIMESVINFKSITNELKKIKAPTLIMNAEHDTLTPRHFHEKMRANIKNCRLMLMQHTCHAFTLEIPGITCRVMEDFVNKVISGDWQGDQSVWIATDKEDSKEIAFQCMGDHTRSIPMLREDDAPPELWMPSTAKPKAKPKPKPKAKAKPKAKSKPTNKPKAKSKAKVTPKAQSAQKKKVSPKKS